MAINGDDLMKMALAAQLGLPIDVTGLPINPEYTDAYATLEKQYNDAPAGVMGEIPNEWANPDAFVSIIEATEKAHGKPRTLTEMGATATPEQTTQSGNGNSPITN